MNTKRVFALLLLLAMILVLLPVRAAKAEECPECGDPLVAKYADVDGHIWVCSRGCGYEQYQDHTLDKNCWCSVCEHYCHDLKTIGYDVHTQPTCTEPGLDYDGLLYICLRCGQYMDDGETPVNPVTAPALGHDLQSVPAKAPTCMEVGWEAYASCSCCEYKENYFEIPVDPNNHAWDTEWTWDDKEHWHPCNNEGCEAKLDAEAHSAHDPEIEQPGKPATCTSPGTTDATFCSVCGAPISEQEIIEPLGHLLTPVAKVEPTCTAPGTEAYWKCTRDGCGMLFSDADGKNETSLEALTIPVDTNAHSWSTDWTKGETTHYYACSQCDERKDEAAHTGGTATCTAKAKCTVCGGEYGELAEHVYPANTWWEDENEHWHVCNVCDQPSAHEAHSGGTATCTEQAECDVCHIPYGEPLGHQIVFVDYVFPTCTEEGMRDHYECTRCGKVFGDAAGTREVEKDRFVMPASGHTEVVDAAVPATCTETGLTEGKHCSLCGEVLKEQETINALGHTPVAVAGKDATCTEAGLTEGSKCSLCGEVLEEQETIEALGHDWGGWEVTNEPQVGLSGVQTRVCGRCGEAETASVDPLPGPKPVPAPEPAPEKPSSPNGGGIYNIASAGFPFMDVTRGMDIYDDVKYVYEKGIMDGVSDTLFGPELTLSRSMIVTLLWRLEGKPAVEYAGVFSDVPAGVWYTDGMEWAASNGIVLGYGDGTFGVNDDVTREQLAAILWRYAKWKDYDVSVGEDTNILSFNDAFDTADWAMPAMQWAIGAGVLEGDAYGYLNGGEPATRAEIAKALHVFLENVAR